MLRIKDIAIEANVSEGTVDRVLHNRGGVSKKTEAKIKEILKNRNFIKNPIASALAKQTKANIAVLIPEYNSFDTFWKSPYNGILKAGNEVKNTGINVHCYKFSQTDPNSYLDSFYKLINTKPTALLLVPLFTKETKIIMDIANKLNINCFFLNVETDGIKNTCFIGQDAYKAGFIAGKLMNLSIPKKAATLIINNKNKVENNTIIRRIKGYNDFFINNNLKNNIHTLNIDSYKNNKSNTKNINFYLENNPSIKGIFVPSSRISTIVACLSKKQLAALKMIGFDNTIQNIEYLKDDSISFLISQKPFEQGYEAIHLIANQLKGINQKINKIYLPIDILIKENIGYHDFNQNIFENNNETNSTL